MTYAELVQKIRDYTETDSNVLTATIVMVLLKMRNGEYIEMLILIITEDMQLLI